MVPGLWVPGQYLYVRNMACYKNHRFSLKSNKYSNNLRVVGKVYRMVGANNLASFVCFQNDIEESAYQYKMPKPKYRVLLLPTGPCYSLADPIGPGIPLWIQ